jgi:predicted 3-demethylubiquinone-9 3-methyltransferase (glyoxalase superfamily)
LHASLLPFLMFEGHAEEAMTFYVSLFSDGEVLEIVRYPSGQSVLGPVMQARFRIAGQVIRCFDSPIRHEFGFTPAISLFVDCTSEEEIGRLATALGQADRR